jgi:hypothetical protein
MRGVGIILLSGLVAAGSLAVQAAQSDYFKEYGVPLAYLIITITLAGAVVKALWSSNNRKDEKMEVMTKEFTSTIRTMTDQHSTAFNKLAEEFRLRGARK